MKPWKRELLILLAAGLAGWTVFATWAVARISSFIVWNDDVWGKMEGKGFKLEWMLAEIIHQFRCTGLVPIVTCGVIVCGVAVWRLRKGTRAGETSTRSDRGDAQQPPA
jgi:hypothetical protein